MDLSTLLSCIGTLLVGGFYIKSGIKHFTARAGMVGYAKSTGAPFAELTVPLTGLLLLIGGLSIITGMYITLGVASLAFFFVTVTPIVHAFWKSPDAQSAGMNRIQFEKNIALLGGALLLLAIPQPWTFTIFHLLGM